MFRIPDVIKHLFIISLIVLLIPLLLKIDLSNILALHYPQNENFGIWQYVTHMFMHGDIPHLLFNFIAIWFFGSSLVDIWGTKKFLFFYLSAGVGAALFYTLIQYYQFNGVYSELIALGVTPSEIQDILTTGRYNDSLISISNSRMFHFWNIFHAPTVGASGALYGVLGAYAIMFPDKKITLLLPPVTLIARYYIITIVLADLFLGVFNRVNDNVGRFAHVGGAIVGCLIAWYWKKNQFKRWN